MKPFEDFPRSGKALLGRPRTGGSCRTGYGLALQQMTGQSACAYCGVDLTGDYYRWLLMHVDHVVPVSVGRALGVPDDYIEDAINKVLACSGCNGFLNRFSPAVERGDSWTVESFIALRDLVFAERKQRTADRRVVETEIFQSRPWEVPLPPRVNSTRSTSTKAKPVPAFEMNCVPGVVEFIDNDAGYLAWVADNTDGYVVNANRKPNATYLILHRATCGTVTGKPARGLIWTVDFVKACSHNLAALEQWGRIHAGGDLRPCGLCKPAEDRKLCPQ